MLFEIAGLGKNLDAPLTTQILADPSHQVVKHILYLYSMQSFIYPAVNKASWNKETKQVEYYGAFAAALSWIIYFANKNREDKLQDTNTLYRGLKMSTSQI